jgi:putative transposase
MIERLTGKNALSAVELSRQTGIRQQNLSRWLQEARSLPLMPSNNPRTQSWSVEQKARVLAEASQLTGEQLNAYLQREGVKLAELERWRERPGSDDARHGPHRRPRNALSPIEEQQILTILASSRYAHLPPGQLVPRLADEGLYVASESTLYRLQRRLGLRHRNRNINRTELTRASTLHRACRANQVWSWDITWLPTTVRGLYLHLYLMMDVWSRRIVGWRIAEGDSAELAAELITQACRDGNVDPKGLVLHSDNGKPMRASTMLSTLQWLGVIPSFSRPHVSEDNPYSESLFRTLKHTPAYPRTPFAGLASAEGWVVRFVAWYNTEHRHSAIRYVTPDQRHFGLEQQILARRHQLYQLARQPLPM